MQDQQQKCVLIIRSEACLATKTQQLYLHSSHVQHQSRTSKNLQNRQNSAVSLAPRHITCFLINASLCFFKLLSVLSINIYLLFLCKGISNIGTCKLCLKPGSYISKSIKLIFLKIYYKFNRGLTCQVTRAFASKCKEGLVDLKVGVSLFDSEVQINLLLLVQLRKRCITLQEVGSDLNIWSEGLSTLVASSHDPCHVTRSYTHRHSQTTVGI